LAASVWAMRGPAAELFLLSFFYLLFFLFNVFAFLPVFFDESLSIAAL
jgi:hypothetical protein